VSEAIRWRTIESSNTIRRVDRVPQMAGAQARIEDLLTERPTLAIPRLGHNAQADLVRKQQVLGSNPSVGSNLLLA
jgi:hypothetical protein